MTTFSRVLTIAVTVFAVLFMGVTVVMTATRTDWKEVATQKFKKTDIAKQQEQIRAFEEQTAAFEAARQRALAAIAADEKAIDDPNTGREVEMEKLLTTLVEQAHTLAGEAEEQARKADVKLEEMRLRRDDAVRLQNQFDEIVSQKDAAKAEAKRLRDLLFQAKGVLERLKRRQQSLEEQTGGKSDLTRSLPSSDRANVPVALDK